MMAVWDLSYHLSVRRARDNGPLELDDRGEELIRGDLIGFVDHEESVELRNISKDVHLLIDNGVRDDLVSDQVL